MDDGINMEDKSKIPVEKKIHILWQTSINDKRPKYRMHKNRIVIVGLIDMEAEVSIIIPEFWQPN